MIDFLSRVGIMLPGPAHAASSESAVYAAKKRAMRERYRAP